MAVDVEVPGDGAVAPIGDDAIREAATQALEGTISEQGQRKLEHMQGWRHVTHRRSSSGHRSRSRSAEHAGGAAARAAATGSEPA
eukprot:9867936-Alexandrium_andersonii.AAC.1